MFMKILIDSTWEEANTLNQPRVWPLSPRALLLRSQKEGPALHDSKAPNPKRALCVRPVALTHKKNTCLSLAIGSSS